MSSGFIEIGKSRTRCPGHGPRLEIAPKIGKSRTEFRHAIMASNILLLDVIHQWRQGVSVWIDWRMEQFKRVGALVIGIAVLVNRRLRI